MKYREIADGIFVDRLNRFIAHVEVNGAVETVHVKNTGRCRELLLPGTAVRLEVSDNPKRKTKYDLVAVHKQGLGWVNMDSQAPNKVVGEWLAKQGYEDVYKRQDKGKADESSSDFLKQLRGKQVFLFGTAGFGGSKEYFNKILKAVQKELHSSNTVIGSFMCQGKMPMSVRQRYENMKKQPLHLPNLDAMIENFDKALSHPDADDLERLKQAVK